MSFEDHELEFPVEWHYKIICSTEAENAADEITKVLRSRGFSETLEKGQQSSGGAYQTFKVSLTFNDKDTMHLMSNLLSSLSCVKYLL